MRASEFITEKKKRKKTKHAAYGPGPYGWYGYDAGYSGDGGGESVQHETVYPFAGAKVGQKAGPAGQLKGKDPKGYPKGKLVGGSA